MNIKIQIFLFSIAIAISLTFLSTQINYPKDTVISVGTPNSYDLVSGFPFEIKRDYSPTAIVLHQTKNTFIPYVLNFLFWWAGTLAFLSTLKSNKPILKLGGILLIALVFMWIDKQDSLCQFQIDLPFMNRCLQLAPIDNYFLTQAISSYLVWSVILSAALAIYLQAKKIKITIVRRLIFAFELALLSSIYNYQCLSILCFSPSGRGFPAAFITEYDYKFPNNLLLMGFIIDIVFWFLAYSFGSWLKRIIFERLVKST